MQWGEGRVRGGSALQALSEGSAASAQPLTLLSPRQERGEGSIVPLHAASGAGLSMERAGRYTSGDFWTKLHILDLQLPYRFRLSDRCANWIVDAKCCCEVRILENSPLLRGADPVWLVVPVFTCSVTPIVCRFPSVHAIFAMVAARNSRSCWRYRRWRRYAD